MTDTTTRIITMPVCRAGIQSTNPLGTLTAIFHRRKAAEGSKYPYVRELRLRTLPEHCDDPWYYLPNAPHARMTALYDILDRPSLAAEDVPEPPVGGRTFGYLDVVYHVLSSYLRKALWAQTQEERTHPRIPSNIFAVLGQSDVYYSLCGTEIKWFAEPFYAGYSKSGQARPPAPDDWKKWFDKLGSLRNLSSGWDSYAAPAPDREAIQRAWEFLEKLQEKAVFPSRLVPSVVGGVGFTFRRNNLKVYLEFNNKGPVHALFSDGSTEPVVRPVTADSAGYSSVIAEVKHYLHE